MEKTVTWEGLYAAIQAPSVTGIVLQVPPPSTRQGFDNIMARQRELRALETCGKPIVALMTPDADLEVALACHYRVGVPLGLPAERVPQQGATQRLGRLLGVAKALPILLGASPLAPDATGGEAEALAWLRSPDVQATQPWDRKGFKLPGGPTSSLAVQNVFVAANAKWAHAPVPRAILSCLYEGLVCDIDTGLQIEARYAVLTEG